MNKPFIKCKDAETIAELKKLGFVVLYEENGVVTFLNDVSKPLNFEKKDIYFTNKIET